MVAAGLFAAFLILGFIVLDWWYFGRPERQSMMYGCPIGSLTLESTRLSDDSLADRFGPRCLLVLPHGRALWFPEGRRILLQADCRRFASRFRTAWPLKGSIEVRQEEGRLRAVCIKRTPWSSATITVLWFLLVVGGSVGFVATFGLDGGFASAAGAMLGFGVLALGALVLFFGMVTVAMAYRIENGRLLQVWQEWGEELAQMRSSAVR